MRNFDVESILKSALANVQVYGTGHNFANENNFKSELFHHVCCQNYNGCNLSEKHPGSKTSIVHCEAKVENGTESSRKADLIFCNPAMRMPGAGNTFNYKVIAVCELKKKFTKKDIATEIDKHDKYHTDINYYYFIDPYRQDKLTKETIELFKEKKITYLTAENKPTNKTAYYSYHESLENVFSAINETLCLYGHNNALFQSFFWCNYEHELNRNVTFPSEGDFNAHLYHRIKMSMPNSHIETEYKTGDGKRIDMVLLGPNDEWCIPIETKQNWDQFKFKYKDRVRTDEESTTIINRFNAMKKRGYGSIKPILIVIQGDNYYSRIYSDNDERNNKHRSLRIIDKSKSGITIFSFNESQNKVGHPTSI